MSFAFKKSSKVSISSIMQNIEDLIFFNVLAKLSHIILIKYQSSRDLILVFTIYTKQIVCLVYDGVYLIPILNCHSNKDILIFTHQIYRMAQLRLTDEKCSPKIEFSIYYKYEKSSYQKKAVRFYKHFFSYLHLDPIAGKPNLQKVLFLL